MDVQIMGIIKHDYNSCYGTQICPNRNLHYFLNINWKLWFQKKLLFVKKFRLCIHEHESCCRICRCLMTSLWAYISNGRWLVACFISIISPIIQNFWWVKWTFQKILNFFLHTSYNFYSYVLITTAVRMISVGTHFHL